MSELRRLWLHLLLLAVAGAFAYVQARPKQGSDRPLEPGQVELWRGNPSQVTKIVFEDERKTVTLVRDEDGDGVWYKGTVEPRGDAASSAPSDGDPHAGLPVEPATFVSVSVAEKLVEGLATLRAERGIGQVAADRSAEFGFDKPDGTLRVTAGGNEQVLLIGGAAPGSNKRYARHEATGAVYVIDGTAARDLRSGAMRLSERHQHAWKFSDADAVTIEGGGATRRVVRSGTAGRRFWAEAASPEVNDETVANWLTKVERLLATGFLEAMPADARKIVRLSYSAGAKELGFFELWHRDDARAPFIVVTEQLRLPATIAKAQASQVADDLATLLPGAQLPDWKSAPSQATEPADAPSATPHDSGDPGGDGHGH